MKNIQIPTGNPPLNRCDWATQDPLYIEYHDHEWGIPVHDDQKLFEMLILEGVQAGLSWLTVLKRRAYYREVFDQFNPEKIALYNPVKVTLLLEDPGIIRNRLKVKAAIINAQQFLKIQEQYLSFDAYLWNFVDGEPIKNHWRQISEVPTNTPLSDTIAKDLKKRGFKFVGTTICYAYMQAMGLVNDHIQSCYCYS